MSDDQTIRDPARAVILARRATELARNSSEAWDTLGLAYYQAGDWGEAVTALERELALLAEKNNPADTTASMRGDNTAAAMTWLYLAMAYGRLGRFPEARSWYDKAVQWTAKNAPRDRKLGQLQTDAAALLGIQEQTTIHVDEAAPRKE
jgi:tetratricopeptide (TPR) repeat protein